MNKIAYGVVSIAGQSFGLPVNSIKTIQAYDGSSKRDGKYIVSLAGIDYQVKHLTHSVNSPTRKLIVVFNSEKNLALFIDEFQSTEINHDLIQTVPEIMQTETSFIHQIFYDDKSDRVIYLCQIENFCHYLDKNNAN